MGVWGGTGESGLAVVADTTKSFTDDTFGAQK